MATGGSSDRRWQQWKAVWLAVACDGDDGCVCSMYGNTARASGERGGDNGE